MYTVMKHFKEFSKLYFINQSAFQILVISCIGGLLLCEVQAKATQTIRMKTGLNNT